MHQVASHRRRQVILMALCLSHLSPWRNVPAFAQDATISQAETLEELGEQSFPGVEIPVELNKQAVRRALSGGLPYESRGEWGMSPHATPEKVLEALRRANVPATSGPVAETWRSVHDHYDSPKWLTDGKFGIFIHFGLYSIPGVNEWYQKYMYGHPEIRASHVARYGSLDKFGYKDFIPLFTLPRFDPDEWAKIFHASGARWVMPTAEHHDGYSLWDSQVNPFNSVRTGPKRDIIGELSRAVRDEGMKFGVTNHTIEHYNFIEMENIPKDLETDLSDPEFADFYWTERSDERLIQHLANWMKRNVELIDKYQPDLIWFDNGANHRMFDPLKLKVAAHYFNRANQWQKEVTLTGKGTSFIAGAIQDFEDIQRAPREATGFTWMVHDRLIDTWGYSEGAKIVGTGAVIRKLVEVVSRNGVYALNVAPKGDGSIPENQQQALREIGQWLAVNGEGIYGTHAWSTAFEGASFSDTAQQYTPEDIRFTAKGSEVYAFLMEWPTSGHASITSLATDKDKGETTKVELLGHAGDLKFTQLHDALEVQLPERKPCEHVWCLKIKMEK